MVEALINAGHCEIMWTGKQSSIDFSESRLSWRLPIDVPVPPNAETIEIPEDQSQHAQLHGGQGLVQAGKLLVGKASAAYTQFSTITW